MLVHRAIVFSGTFLAVVLASCVFARDAIIYDPCDIGVAMARVEKGEALLFSGKVVRSGDGFMLIGDKCAAQRGIPLSHLSAEMIKQFNESIETEYGPNMRFAMKGLFSVEVAGNSKNGYLGWLLEARFLAPDRVRTN